MSSVLKNTKKIFTGTGNSGGGDPSLPGRVTTLENNEYKITYYEIISGASGSLTVPTGATINAGEFGLSGNAILSKIDGSNKPTFESPVTSGGTVVTASLDETNGNWVASGVYTDTNVALIYSIKIKAVDYSNLTYSNIIETTSNNEEYTTVNVWMNVTNLADSTTYYFGQSFITAGVAANNFRRCIFNLPGTSKIVAIRAVCLSNTATSSQDCVLKLINNTTSAEITLGNVRFDNVTYVYLFTGLTFSGTNGDEYSFKLEVPALTTNGLGSQCYFELLFKKD